MLKLTVPGDSYFDEVAEEFVTIGDYVLELEHSLASLSKWEQKFEKPFLVPGEKTEEELFYYICCMNSTPDIPSDVFGRFTPELVEKIDEYINAKMTATWFRNSPGGKSGEIITNEVVYYWMFSLRIPKECEHWHLNRLITQIRVFDAKNGSQKKRSPAEIAAERHALNERRRAQYNTAG